MAASRDHKTSEHSEKQRYKQMLFDSYACRNIARLSPAHFRFTVVGSFPTYTGTNYSDVDILVEPTLFIIDESLLVYRRDIPCYVKIPVTGLPSDASYIRHDSEYVLSASVRHSNEWLGIESSLYLNTQHTTDTKVGQKVSLDFGSVDIVRQLRLSALPQKAREFPTRDRSWPPAEIISMVINGEFHLLARPAPLDPDPDHDFCISFAKAELIITNSMSVSQLLCLKLLKRIRHTIDREEKVLTSYHMKTASLWYFEQAGIDIGESYLPVVNILTRLDMYLEDECLPHYFISTANIFTGITKSDLFETRRHLHSFLGFCLVRNDLTTINSDHWTHLAINITNVCHFALASDNESETHGLVLQAAENVYANEQTTKCYNRHDNIRTGHVKKWLSIFVMRAYPQKISFYADGIKKLQTDIHVLANGWVRSGRITVQNVLTGSSTWVNMVATAHYEPLGEFIPMGFHKTGPKLGRNSSSENRKRIMNQWLLITDNVITSLWSHANSVVDQLLVGVWIADIYPVLSPLMNCVTPSIRSDDASHARIDDQDIDKLFCLHHVTRKLVSSVVDAIGELSAPAVEYGARAFVPTRDTGTLVNLYLLWFALEELFIPVEYAIVSNIHSHASGVSRDHWETELHHLMSESGLEYQCIKAYHVIEEVVILFHHLCHLVADFHVAMTCITHTKSDQNI